MHASRKHTIHQWDIKYPNQISCIEMTSHTKHIHHIPRAHVTQRKHVIWEEDMSNNDVTQRPPISNKDRKRTSLTCVGNDTLPQYGAEREDETRSTTGTAVGHAAARVHKLRLPALSHHPVHCADLTWLGQHCRQDKTPCTPHLYVCRWVVRFTLSVTGSG